jgi:hypothetical protein
MRYFVMFCVAMAVVAGIVVLEGRLGTFKPGTCIQREQEKDVWELQNLVHKVELVGDYSYLVCEYKKDCVYLESLIADKADPKGFWLFDSIRISDSDSYRVVSCELMGDR